MRDGTFAHIAARREHGHALTVARVTSDVALNASVVFRKVPPDERHVAAMRIVVKELRAQFGFGFGRLGNDQQSAGVFVDAVHQSDARVVRVVSRQTAQMPSDSVDQRAVEVAHTRVDHKSCGFIDHHQLVVFVNDVERNILGLYRGVVVRAVHHQRHHVARTNLIIAFHRTVVHVHHSRVACLLYAVTRRVLQLLEHELVDADRCLTTVGLHAIVLVELRRLFIVVLQQLCRHFVTEFEFQFFLFVRHHECVIRLFHCCQPQALPFFPAQSLPQTPQQPLLPSLLPRLR